MAMHDFIAQNEGQIFRFRVYRKIYTPYEIEKKYMDELDTTEYSHGMLTDAIDLGNGDYLMEFQEGYIDEHFNDDGECETEFKSNHKIYHRLSDIILEKFDCDNGIEEEYEECL